MELILRILSLSGRVWEQVLERGWRRNYLWKVILIRRIWARAKEFLVGLKPRGLVLVAPFSTLAKLLETYNLGGWIPLLKPLQGIPQLQSNSIVLRLLILSLTEYL